MLGEVTADRAVLDSILDQTLTRSTADETEAFISVSDSALTRYTRNSVHENMTELNRHLNVRAVIGKRIGVASTNKLDADGIAEVVARATEIAKLSPEDADFPGLPGDDGRPVLDPPTPFDDATAALSPDARADAVDKIARVMLNHSLHAAGYVASRSDALALGNSKGVRRFFKSTDAAVNIKAIGPDSSGYAEGYSRSFAALDFSALAERAAAKAVGSAHPGTLDPGHYTVILEPPAVHEFLVYLSWIGFGAQPFEEGSSFMAGKIGEKIMGANVTIRDDYAHALGDGIPFDFEGVPRQQVTLVQDGFAADVVFDSYYAAKLKHSNTGHALPAPNSEGPLPLNIVVDPGTKTVNDLIAETQRGILVTRTWYIRLVDQKKTLITGMTRDGLFLIANGKVTKGLRNMRFNESIVDALGRCEPAKDLVRSESHVVPALKIENFHFTSGTEF